MFAAQLLMSNPPDGSLIQDLNNYLVVRPQQPCTL
jgi:hypothetical protein